VRYAIISDIHSNLEALRAVLEHAGVVDGVWCLGDIVGYGPNPNECIELVRARGALCVVGNHDYAAIGRLDTADFNPDAATAAYWTGRQLTPENRRYLEELPIQLTQGDFTLVHGSPRYPIWEYILSAYVASLNLDHFQTQFCLIGHSHIPSVFRCPEGERRCEVEELLPKLSLQTLDRLIINPGGVGQPRDGDPRAAYAILDTDARILYHFRVPYDIAMTQQKMREAGLPRRLIERLSYGL